MIYKFQHLHVIKVSLFKFYANSKWPIPWIETRIFLELRIPEALWCFGVKDRVQQVLRVLWDFNFLSLFSPFTTLFQPLLSTPIFSRFLFLLKVSSSSSFSCTSTCAYVWNERQFITELTNGQKDSRFFFLSLFLPPSFIYLRLSLWEIPVGLLDLKWSHNAHVHLKLKLVYE